MLIALLAGCMMPPEPATDAGRDVFNLYFAILIMAAAVFVGVEGFLIYAIFRYRRAPGDDTLPAQLHGNNVIEVVWVAIPTVIVLVLFGLSMVTLATVEARAEEPGVTIEVDAFQWTWTFRYADEDVVIQGGAGNPPTMPVPVGEPVRLILTSPDVIHSFYVPEFLIKRDVVPFPAGEDPNTLEFTVSREGTYHGQCAEFCGDLHHDMTFLIHAMPREQYDADMEARRAGETPAPTLPDDATSIAISANNTAFDIDEFEVPADQPFTIEFENLEDVPHNVAIYDGATVLFQGEFLNTAGSVTYTVNGLPPGEYRFICDAHPQQMVGTVIVSE